MSAPAEAGSIMSTPSSPAVVQTRTFEPTEPADSAASGFKVAWQPSHQSDTGPGWDEAVVCLAIAKSAKSSVRPLESIVVQELGHGRYGSNNYRPRPINPKAFDSEVSAANGFGADAFVSIHNDSGAPSGILGEYLPGDERGRRLCAALVKSLCAATGLHDRGLREVRLYSLEQSKARYRCLLEIGDNIEDRAYLRGHTAFLGTTVGDAMKRFARSAAE